MEKKERRVEKKFWTFVNKVSRPFLHREFSAKDGIFAQDMLVGIKVIHSGSAFISGLSLNAFMELVGCFTLVLIYTVTTLSSVRCSKRSSGNLQWPAKNKPSITQ